jgi:hypothetical protein
VYDPTTARFYLRNSNAAGRVDVPVLRLGASGRTPVAGDWDGDGSDSIGVVDPLTQRWRLLDGNVAAPSAADLPVFVVPGGVAGWSPIVGNWDGR